MPIVRVNMFEGRSLEKKRRLVSEISRIVADVCEVEEAGVHVLIEEMSRDNWGRGGTLHRDRGPKGHEASAFARTTFRSVSWVRVHPANVAVYLDYRQEQVNPAMATMPGFRGTLTLRDLADDQRFLIVNSWADEAAWRGYQATSEHDRLRDRIRGELVEQMEIGRYATVALPLSGNLDDEQAPHRYFTVSTHRVKTNSAELYLKLRSTSVHPAMAAFAGFMSSNALESLDEHYAYLIVNGWQSREAAERYSTDSTHFALRDQVRAILSEHSGTRHYELVMP